jgi:hypothetical protein
MSTPQAVVRVPARPPATNAVEATDIRDIKPPVRIPSGWEWVGWLALALGVLAFLFLLRRWWRRRRTAQAARAVLVVPPHVRARDRLQQAMALRGQPLPFCIAVSDALRDYLEERFHLHAPERTTEEFLDELQSSPVLSLTQKQSLGKFLSQCDLVKFARYEPREPELQDLWSAAMHLVDETAPAPPSAAPEAGGTTAPPVTATVEGP